MSESDPLVSRALVRNGVPETSTFSSLVFNLVLTTIGGCVMALPFTLLTCGYVFGTVLLLGSALINLVSALALAQLAAAYPLTSSYEGLCKVLLGRKGELACEISLAIVCYGALCMYLIISLQLLEPFAALLGLDEFMTRVIITLVMATCSLPKSLHALRHISLVALMGLFYIFVVICFFAIQKKATGRLPFEETEFASHGSEAEYEQAVIPFKFGIGVALAIPTQTMAFSCHLNVPRAYHQLQSRFKPQMGQILTIVVFTAFVCYAFISEAHFYLFNGYRAPLLTDNLLADFPTSSSLMNAGRIAIALCLMCKGPLIFQPLRDIVWKPVLARADDSAILNFMKHALRTYFGYALVLVGAAMVPQLLIAISIIGATGGSLTTFIFPGLMLYYSCQRSTATSNDIFAAVHAPDRHSLSDEYHYEEKSKNAFVRLPGFKGVCGRLMGAALATTGLFISILGLASVAYTSIHAGAGQ